MRRRHFLASTAALLAGPLAGCAHPNAVLVMEDVSNPEIAERASRTVENHPLGRNIVADAVANGTTNASGRSRPLETDRPIAWEGRYYELTATATGRHEATEYTIQIDYDPETATPGGRAIDYEDLPAVDRNALKALLPPIDEDAGGEGYDFGMGRTYSETDLEQSVLVPEQEYGAVVYDGERYPIDVGDGRTVTVREYRYEAAEIAASADEFGAAVRQRYAFTLSGLTDDERSIVEEAVDGGYYEGSANDAFESLVRRFHEHEGVRADEWGGDWLARYDGTVYWAELQHPPDAVEG